MIRPQDPPVCARKGCTRGCKNSRYPHSSPLRENIDARLTDAEDRCRRLGSGTRSSEFWAAAVALNDAATDFDREIGRALGVIRSQGH